MSNPIIIQATEFEPMKSEISTALSQDNTVAEFIVQNAIEPQVATALVEYVKTQAEFTANISLPASLRDTRMQIELDNLISNRLYHSNRTKLTVTPVAEGVNAPPATKIGRQLPSVISPQIEFTLYVATGAEPKPTVVAQNETKRKRAAQKPLEPLPIAAELVDKILSQNQYADQKQRWESLSRRDDAITFRKILSEELKVKNIADHPLHFFIKDSPLSTTLSEWSVKLELELSQYDALLDVYGQYGEAGLTKLFNTWSFNNNANLQATFIEAHEHVLKYMPTYLPFIEDTASLTSTIEKINLLQEADRSWWLALLKNQDAYTDLETLFEDFAEKIDEIKKLHLTLPKITAMQHKGPLKEVLSKIITHLKNCPELDRQTQLDCIHKVNITERYPVVTPIMETSTGKELDDFLGELDKKDLDPKSMIPAFYRYVSQQKKHLPFSRYEEIITSLVEAKDPKGEKEIISNSIKSKMLYLLAKSTSTNAGEQFSHNEVEKEWNSLQSRIMKLDSIDRLAHNQEIAGMGKFLFYTGIAAKGGRNGARGEAINPLLQFDVIPPMNFLNKLLLPIEYRFLNPRLNIAEMISANKKSMVVMSGSSKLYTKYPDLMINAVRHLVGYIVEAPDPATNLYVAKEEDRYILERFVLAANTIIDNDVNPEDKYSPVQILLPLLTTFRLEYAVEEKKCTELMEVIAQYKKNIAGEGRDEHYKERIKRLLPYGLKLFDMVTTRNGPPPLSATTLNEVQAGLLDLICQEKEPSRKNIRAWIDTRYSTCFAPNALLDINDEVDLTQLFAGRDISASTKDSITSIVQSFDGEGEAQEHGMLIENLLKLDASLTSAEKASFFEYCTNAFKTKGLFHRDLQKTEPSFILQFNELVKTLVTYQCFDQFTQYMNITQARLTTDNIPKNSIAKSTYFLGTLFPSFASAGSGDKETFLFAADLVCLSSLEELQQAHPYTKIPNKANHQKLFADLATDLDNFHKLEHQTYSFLKKIKGKMDAIIAFSADDPILFKACRASRELIDRLIKDEAAAIDEENQGLSYYYKARFLKARSDKINARFIAQLSEKGLYNTVSKDKEDIANQEFLRSKSTSFEDVVSHLHHKKKDLISKYPNISKRAQDFISKVLELYPGNLTKKHNTYCHLIDELIEFNDQNLVLSLMYHYAGAVNDVSALRTVNDLVELLNHTDYSTLPAEVKKDFINAIITQMNNGVTLSKEEITSFLVFVSTNHSNANVMRCLKDFYQHAPFPSLNKFQTWTSAPNFQDTIGEVYKQFDTNPCAAVDPHGKPHDGREITNGFKIDKAKEILSESPSMRKTFKKSELDLVERESNRAKALSTKQILEQLEGFRNKKHKNPSRGANIRLVMLLAELLHRCKGRPPIFEAGKQKAGVSFELNTTQIMAIISMLNRGNKVTSEIGTGEGKSRIMMMMNACQWLKGNTVDFLTSNIELAERDFLASLPFFQSLKCPVNFITATSQIEDYRQDGINFSDPKNLCLFRNKALGQDRLDEVLTADTSRRALLLDEADVTYFDVSNTQYNYSSTTKQFNVDILPVYPLVMEYFAAEGQENIYKTDKERCTEGLLSKIRENPELAAAIAPLSENELHQWLENLQFAAYQARHLKYNDHYSVVANAKASTTWGDKDVAAALCRIESRADETARFRGGVHQCLHSELNRLMKCSSYPSGTDGKLITALEKCKSKDRVFQIEPERTISFSTTSGALLKNYGDGSMLAVTGTIGIKMEQEEAKSNFGTEFIRVPRHEGLKREDKPIHIAKNDKAYLDALAQHIRDSQAKGQPILLICKDDSESQELKDLLSNYNFTNIHRIHATTNHEDDVSEAKYIKDQAGLPRAITITTEMEGRGTDIELHGDANEVGLKVLLTYLPKNTRDYGQIIGRSGRFGKIGESQMVLNYEKLKNVLGLDAANEDFFVYPEAFIRELQLFSAYTQGLHRLFNKSFDDVLIALTDVFKQLQPNIDLKNEWKEFLSQYEISRKTYYDIIIHELQKAHPDPAIIREALENHQEKTAKIWEEFSEPFKSEYPSLGEVAIPEIKSPRMHIWLDELHALQQHPHQSVVIEDTRVLRVQTHYDPLRAGRVQLLQDTGKREWFANLRASIDQGRFLLFPNTRALLTGKLSFTNWLSQFSIMNKLFNIKPKEESHKVTIQVSAKNSSSYAMFIRQMPGQLSSEEDSDEDIKTVDHVAREDSFLPGSDENTSEYADDRDHTSIRNHV